MNKKQHILQQDYTAYNNFNQVTLEFDLGYRIPATDPVRLLSQFVEELNLAALYSTYTRIRENS
ncbi:MAG: hypothetical protein ACRC7N_09580, partial [Clostridium sp.]